MLIIGLLLFIFIFILNPGKSVVIDNVSPATAVFNPPSVMIVGISRDVDATVYLTTMNNSTFNVTPIISADLYGPGFSINGISPHIQSISSRKNATWKWYATPVREGKQNLTLAIYNIYIIIIHLKDMRHMSVRFGYKLIRSSLRSNYSVIFN